MISVVMHHLVGMGLKGNQHELSCHMGQFFQTELTAEIYSKSPVSAIGKVLARTPINTCKGDEKWPLFVNKQLFCWSVSITLDNNNDVLADF